MVRREPRLFKKGKDDNWQLVFYNPETRRQRWVSTGTTDKRRAERVKSEVLKEWDRGEYDPFDLSSERPTSITLAEAAARYLEEKRPTMTDAAYRDAFSFYEMMKRRVGEDRPVDAMTQEEWEAMYLRRELRPASRFSYYARTRVLINYSRKKGYLKHDVLRRIRRPAAPAKVPIFLSRADAALLLAHLETRRPWLYALCSMALATGMRFSELKNMQWKDIDLAAGFIFVKGKGGRERYVPVFPMAESMLLRINPVQERPIMSSKGRLVLSNNTHRAFRKAVRDLGLDERYHFHSLRHTFASWLVQEGVPIYDVSKWLGHTTITTTEVYAHLAPKSGSEKAREVLGGL